MDLTAGVTSVEDLSCNRLTITPAGINHSSGERIDLGRDSEGRLIRHTDGRGTTSYTHDARDQLLTRPIPPVTVSASLTTEFGGWNWRMGDM